MELLKKFIELVPGLSYVIAIAAALIAIAAQRHTEKLDLSILLVIVGASWVVLFVGSLWDDILFDPLYSKLEPDASRPKQVWWEIAKVFLPIHWVLAVFPKTHQLDTVRDEAANTLKPHRQADDYTGLHETAQKVIKGTEDWKKQVEPWLEVSKASRTLIFPLLIFAAYRFAYPWHGVPTEGWLITAVWSRTGAVGLLLVATLVYVYLRIWHMVNLYILVKNADVFRWTIPDTEGKVRAMLTVDSISMPTQQLPFLATSSSLQTPNATQPPACLPTP